MLLANSFLFIKLFIFTFSDQALRKLIEYIIFSGVLNAVVMFFQLFSETFNKLTTKFFEVIVFENKFDLILRINGLSSTGGAALSVLMALSLVLIHFREKKFKVKNWSSFMTVIMTLFLFFGLVYSGRTGFVFLSTYFIFYYMNKLQIIKIVKGSAVVFVVVMLVFFVLDKNSVKSEQLSALSRTFELFIRLREEGQIRTDSSDSLLKMFILPKNEFHILFGDGNFGRKVHLPYVPSDVFYVRLIFGYGILGLLIFFIQLLVMTNVILKQKSPIRWLVIFLISEMILLNFKEVFYFGTAGLPSVVCLLLVAHFSSEFLHKKMFNLN